MKPDKGTKSVRASRYRDATCETVEDLLTVEAPLHIKLNGESFTTTMRTPGEDEPLVRGLLFTEGIVTDPGVALEFSAIADPETGEIACLEVTVAQEAVAKSVEGRRSLISSSSCGVCGIREPSEIEVYGPPLEIAPEEKLAPQLIPGLFARMRESQRAFAKSGGAHAAAVFDPAGTLLIVREDIGRHNAVDKAVGTLLEQGRLAEAHVILVSGRVSYEIVYKAYRASIPFLLAVSAVSSMAVETAERLGMTVIGFCREGRATVYSHGEHIAPDGAGA